MRQVAVIIWVILAIVGAGASILLTLDMFRLRLTNAKDTPEEFKRAPLTRMGKYWGLMLAGDAAFAFALILAIVMSRREASTISVVVGLSLLLLGQAFKTATAGACALHMRGNLNGSGKRAPQTKETKDAIE